MKELPPFTDFISSIDTGKFGFDFEFFQGVLHYDEKAGPLSIKEKQEVSQIASSILLAYLQAYHIWICEELRKREDRGDSNH